MHVNEPDNQPGTAALFNYGRDILPWHGLGTKLDDPATAEEAISAAGLDYYVTMDPLLTSTGAPVADARATVRTDTGQPLGVVTKHYTPVQNRDAFGFLDGICGTGELRYHTAGALGRGERVWMLAKLPGSICVRGSDDMTDKYLLLSNSHDGKAALRVFFTPIRVVCSNTLSLAHRNGEGTGIAIRHRGDLTTKIEEARRVLGIANQRFHQFAEEANYLASYAPSTEQLRSFFEALYPNPPLASATRARNTRDVLHRLFEEGRGQNLPATRGTWWSAVNAVTEFVDHHRLARGHHMQDRAARRLESQWFGSGARLKGRAWSLALDAASAN